MNLYINQKYNKLFGDPYFSKPKWLTATYNTDSDIKYTKIFKENDHINITNIKEIISIQYGYKDKWIEVKNKCKLNKNLNTDILNLKTISNISNKLPQKLNNKYFLFVPMGGINDIFSTIQKVIYYCNKNKRTLLVDMTNSYYGINFSEYFYIKKSNCNIIYDSNEIKNILLYLKNNNSLIVSPNNLHFNLIDLFNKNKNKKIKKYIDSIANNINRSKPIPINVDENIIFRAQYGGGNGFEFFKNISLRENIKKIISKKLTLLKKDYLCIHVRNTDIKCDYKSLYMNNKDYIHSFNEIYICTDDKLVYDFFKSKLKNAVCFTTFPHIYNKNLHNSNIPSNIKMIDLLTDIFVATNSKSIISYSKGGFIKFLRNCHKNKKYVLNMLS
jgi:hypothetical protein